MRHLLPFPLICTLLGLPVAALAQQEEPTVSAQVANPIAISADLRAEYLRGFPLLITITVKNEGSTPLSFPDLSSRPYLVRFQLVDKDGKKQTRFTTPPEKDTDQRWELAPRGRRQVLLEIPSSGALSGPSYDLTVSILDGDVTHELPTRSLSLEAPNPSHAHLTQDGSADGASGWMFPWVQHGESSFDLYLFKVSSQVPTVRGHHYHLLALSGDIQPWLAASRSRESTDRHIYWKDDADQLQHARLKSGTLRYQPRAVGVPYPAWDLLARGITDTQGGLHVPIWIPAPNGVGGEVRVISVDDRGQATFRKVVKMASRPQAVTAVDSVAHLRLALLYDDKVDIYTLKTEPGVDLPASGRRVFRPVAPQPDVAPSQPWSGLMFGTLPPQGEEPGGLALFTWRYSAGEVGGVEGAWFTLEGRAITQVPSTPLPEGARLLQVLPRGYADIAVLWALGDGSKGGYRAGSGAPAVSLAGLNDSTILKMDGSGRLQRVQLEQGVGIQVTALEIRP